MDTPVSFQHCCWMDLCVQQYYLFCGVLFNSNMVVIHDGCFPFLSRRPVLDFAACWEQVMPRTSCIIATGNPESNGYVRWQRRGIRLGAHQWTWIDHYGPIEDGKWILHKCDNRPCINILHLYEGDHAQNQKDKSDRRRIHGRRNPNAKLTGPQVR